ncbi:hypothetical protein IKF57_01690 [Candidatus Saccharibacteria bacterium]|nr:hypothetical protein [Candidatus Saccharibacteria bacterium]
MDPNTNQNPNNQTPASMPEGINPQPTPASETPVSAWETPAPEVQPTPQPVVAPEPALQAKDSIVEDHAKKPASRKTTITLVVILVILLAAAGIGFGVWSAINANQKPAPVQPTEPTTPTDEPTADVTEEVELTDANIIKDLDQKIAYLNFTNEITPTFKTYRGHPETRLYKENPLSESYKQSVVSSSLIEQYRTATADELAALRTDYPNFNFTDYTQVVDADAFSNRYLDLFGSKLNRDIAIEVDETCPSQYDKTTNLYFDPPLGCGGGTSAVETYFSKNKYTIANDDVYVYVNAVTVDYDTGNVYCSAMYWWGEGAPEPCGTINPTDYQTATYETFKEYGDRTTYRFTFKKADNGTYYFDKVEKIENIND